MSSSALDARSAFSLETTARPRLGGRVWINVLLLVLTLISTTVMGARMQYNFDHSLPFFDMERDFDFIVNSWQQPVALLAGLPFSLTLLTILMAHEMGHYLACVYYGIDASLPYFLPAPTPITGTFGAFIRIRSAIYSKRVLFDIGIAGPIAGFVFLLPALSVGLALSKVLPDIAHAGTFHPGTPLVLLLLEKAIFPGVGVSDLYLHPVVRAGWVGLLATAMNLLPIGQLDGGHILYAISPAKHKTLSKVLIGVLFAFGLFYRSYGWCAFAVILFFAGRRHPAIYDPEDIGPVRYRFALLALVIFVLSFMPAPI